LQWEFSISHCNFCFYGGKNPAIERYCDMLYITALNKRLII
jgi:hypothetical protein